eukprot:1824879-Heterocapsa_arctica.AAC.1
MLPGRAWGSLSTPSMGVGSLTCAASWAAPCAAARSWEALISPTKARRAATARNCMACPCATNVCGPLPLIPGNDRPGTAPAIPWTHPAKGWCLAVAALRRKLSTISLAYSWSER